MKVRVKSPWHAFVLIAVTASVIYSNIYQNPFVFDDVKQIVEKQTIRHVGNYISSEQILKPRAVVDLTFAMNYAFGKLDVAGYHVFNLLIHIMNGFLVYCLALSIFRQVRAQTRPEDQGVDGCIMDVSTQSMSVVSALIFVAHPIQTQAVTYVVQRYTSMAALFYLASVLFYLKARILHVRGKVGQGDLNRAQQEATGSEEKGRKCRLAVFYTLSMACGLLAFLSKQNTASLPGAILLVEYLFVSRAWQAWKRRIPWIVLGFVLWTVVVLYVCGFFSGHVRLGALLEDVSDLFRETETVTRWSYLCTQANVIVIYVRLLFLPVHQNLDYLYPFKKGFLDGLTPFAFLFLMALGGFGVSKIKKKPVVAFGILWFFITLSVESSIVPIKDALFEHRLYLPMAGFAIVLSYWLFSLLVKKRYWANSISILIILALGVSAHLRNNVWQNRVALWSDVVSKSPMNPRGYYNLGLAWADAGNLKKAEDYYSMALGMNSDYVEAHNNLGLVLAQTGRVADAIQHYVSALRVKPDYVEALTNMGIAHASQGHVKKATQYYLKALRIRPNYAPAHNNLGIVLAKQGKTQEAMDHFSKALRILPDYADAQNNLGLALAGTGRIDEAINHYHAALRIKPDYAEAHYNLALALTRAGRFDDASGHFLEAVAIKPDMADAIYRLGVIAARQGDLNKAVTNFERVLAMQRDNAKAHHNLGIALARQGKMDEAIAHFSAAVKIRPDYAEARQALGRALRQRRNVKAKE